MAVSGEKGGLEQFSPAPALQADAQGAGSPGWKQPGTDICIALAQALVLATAEDYMRVRADPPVVEERS